MTFDFQLPDWSKIFEIFFVENFFYINSKLLYILNFDDKLSVPSNLLTWTTLACKSDQFYNFKSFLGTDLDYVIV